ncbi:MAG: hypothetical protein JSW02_05195 [candidate division WOR-3 bacterium]|nr:MAG: hypothetical protein JSW02_05195 [candidate division WOR-3 bacterium]
MVYRKILIFLTIGCYITVTQGCYTSRQITQEQLESQQPRFIRRIITVDNRVYDFPEGTYAYTQDSMIIVKTPDGDYISFQSDKVKTIYQYGLDDKKMCMIGTGIGIGCIVGVVIFALLLKLMIDIGKSTGEY